MSEYMVRKYIGAKNVKPIVTAKVSIEDCMEVIAKCFNRIRVQEVERMEEKTKIWMAFHVSHKRMVVVEIVKRNEWVRIWMSHGTSTGCKSGVIKKCLEKREECENARKEGLLHGGIKEMKEAGEVWRKWSEKKNEPFEEILRRVQKERKKREMEIRRKEWLQCMRQNITISDNLK